MDHHRNRWSELRLLLTGWLFLGSLLGVVLLSGCYDGRALVEQRKALVIRDRLEEVDLGEFRVTMPRPYSELERAEIYFHAFGQVANRDLASVHKLIDKNSPEVKHRLLLTIRQMDMGQIADPDLQDLRTSIQKSFNETIEGDPVQSVGFYEFGFSNY